MAAALAACAPREPCRRTGCARTAAAADPTIVFNSVLLPEPLSPTIAKISPFSISTLIPLCTARRAVTDGDVLDADPRAR